jgi:AraC-like DNA-binding protein
LSGSDNERGGIVPATTIASWAALVWRALEARGVPPGPLFVRAGIDPVHLQDAGARLPVAAMTRLWELAVESTGDLCFGISAGQYVHPTTFHALGYAWFASDTLREALGRFVRYTRLVSSALTLRMVEAGATVDLVFEDGRDQHLASTATDAGLAALVTLCRTSCGDSFKPRGVRLARAQRACQSKLDSLFRAPISYGASDTAVVFDAADLDRALPTANADLARAADEVILRYLARFDREDVVTQVRTKLLELMPSGKASARNVAAALHLGGRSLQRKLAGRGTSVARLLEETRRELAEQYMRNSMLSVGEITYLLGFAEPASFTRAFRRWTGRSPSEYRRRAGNDIRGPS